LSVDPRVNYSRPSADVLFESAAFVYERSCIGIVLTGANNDGSAGLRKIKEYGGTTIAQDPETAEYSAMPLAAIKANAADYILPLKEIAAWLINFAKVRK
jgi:two-component system chemotaxis response regulator CheB